MKQKGHLCHKGYSDEMINDHHGKMWIPGPEVSWVYASACQHWTMTAEIPLLINQVVVGYDIGYSDKCFFSRFIQKKSMAL